MPRPLRIKFPNAWYHIMNRGADRQVIFKSKKQRKIFTTLLSEANKYFNLQVHAYCLMDNHYHLLVKTPRSNLYSRDFNDVITAGKFRVISYIC